MVDINTNNNNNNNNNSTRTGGGATNKPLPVLLIHGYGSDASVWSKWEDLLKKDGITFYPITFYKSAAWLYPLHELDGVVPII
ncbi:MAG TPA: hypothetical protein VI278_01765 [Nitrososphaeraceae archaeon]